MAPEGSRAPVGGTVSCRWSRRSRFAALVATQRRRPVPAGRGRRPDRRSAPTPTVRPDAVLAQLDVLAGDLPGLHPGRPGAAPLRPGRLRSGPGRLLRPPQLADQPRARRGGWASPSPWPWWPWRSAGGSGCRWPESACRATSCSRTRSTGPCSSTRSTAAGCSTPTACRAALPPRHGRPDATWSADFLAPVGNLSIVTRMLNNLRVIYSQRHDLGRAAMGDGAASRASGRPTATIRASSPAAWRPSTEPDRRRSQGDCPALALCQ